MRLALFAWFLCLCAAGAGCSSVVTTAAVRDAQLGARVKTALVNDPEMGTRPIEVRVVGGVVRLAGRVDSEAQLQRTLTIVKGVEGVTDVISDLRIGAAIDVAPGATPDQEGLFIEEEREPQLLALGVSVGSSVPSSEGLERAHKVGVLLRLGSGGGLGATIGFGWFNAGWRSEAPGAPVMGRVRIRPLMGGLAYGFRADRASLSLSLVGGRAFNSLSLPDTIVADNTPLSIDNSWALRPGASLWIDLDRRFALNVFGGYLVTRPRVRLIEDGVVRTRSLRADALLINTGIVYKIF